MGCSACFLQISAGKRAWSCLTAGLSCGNNWYYFYAFSEWPLGERWFISISLFQDHCFSFVSLVLRSKQRQLYLKHSDNYLVWVSERSWTRFLREIFYSLLANHSWLHFISSLGCYYSSCWYYVIYEIWFPKYGWSSQLQADYFAASLKSFPCFLVCCGEGCCHSWKERC
jgi:hypothetical protein